jgi:hypothetical protein
VSDNPSPANEQEPQLLYVWLRTYGVAAFSFLILLVLLVHQYEGFLATIRTANLSAANAISGITFQSFEQDFSRRFAMCDYSALVLCTERATPAVEAISLNDWAPAPFGWMWDVISSVPKVPDATWFLIQERWVAGNTVPFVALCLFLFVNAVIILRAGIYNPLAWLLAPTISAFLLWLLQLTLLAASEGAGPFLQSLLLVAGLPSSLLALLKHFSAARDFVDPSNRIVHAPLAITSRVSDRHTDA